MHLTRSVSAFCTLGGLSIDKAKPFFYNCTIANTLMVMDAKIFYPQLIGISANQRIIICRPTFTLNLLLHRDLIGTL
jgi:hypothetical protein